jgi:hypothetical protein
MFRRVDSGNNENYDQYFNPSDDPISEEFQEELISELTNAFSKSFSDVRIINKIEFKKQASQENFESGGGSFKRSG